MNNIQIYKVSVQSAFRWFSRAWHIFKEQSGLFMSATFFIFVSMILASMIGIVGSVVFALAQPFLSAGIYHLAFKADNGVESKFSDLFVAFSDLQSRRVLLQLGALGLLFATAMAPMSIQIRQMLLEQQSPDGNLVALYMLAHLVYYMVFLFAVPIAHFYHEQSLLRVIKTGLLACLSNPSAMIMLLMLSSLLVFLSSFTIFLAMIVFMPLIMIVIYLAFNDILRPALPFDSEDDDDQNDQNNSGNGSDFKIEV